MATRNFVFRKSPDAKERGGRYALAGSTVLTSGVPVVATTGTDEVDRQLVVLATGEQAKPKVGLGGIAVFENIDFIGTPLGQTTFSDVDQIVPGDAVQVVTGTAGTVKVAFTNIASGGTFINRPNYPKGRIMVAGVSQATPTIAVGDYLTPGIGNDTDGYWQETSNAANGWLVVTKVDSELGLVEAEVNF